eukprot:SAG11_NODE_1516_length_4766_cov_1.916006_7_plen_120_part_00
MRSVVTAGSHKWGDQKQQMGAVAASLPQVETNAETGRPSFDLSGFGDLDLSGFTPPPGIDESAVARPCPVARGEVHFHREWRRRLLDLLHLTVLRLQLCLVLTRTGGWRCLLSTRLQIH